MLPLTRKIGDDIVAELIAINGIQIGIGVDAHGMSSSCARNFWTKHWGSDLPLDAQDDQIFRDHVSSQSGRSTQ